MTPPKDRLRSWREEPPKTPKEAATAELLQTLRSEPTLSPEALARVERRVREDARTTRSQGLPALAIFRPAVLAAAGGTLLAVFALAYFGFERRPSLDLPSVARLVPPSPTEAEPMNAAADKEAPPAVDKKREEFAVADQPPAAVGASSAKSQRKLAPNPSYRSSNSGVGLGAGSMSAGAHAPAPSAQAGAPARSLAKAGATSDVQLDTVESAPSALSPSAAEAERGSASSAIHRAETLAANGRCPEAIPILSSIVASSDESELMQRALFGRAHCYLAIGQRQEAFQDLLLYLSRFPNGRFALQAQDLLR